MRLDDPAVLKSIKEAYDIFLACIGNKGVAASPDRYQGQNWTRDFVLAFEPFLLESGNNRKLAKTHLKNLACRQRRNGQIPILFLDETLPFLKSRIKRSLQKRKMPDGTIKREMSFMLKRWLTGQLWNLTPGTRDSELLYILGVYEFIDRYPLDTAFQRFHYNHIDPALDYIQRNLIADHLMIGCDWRDTMHEELGYRPLLTNNSLLYRMYMLMGNWQAAQEVADAIHRKLWDGKHYLDYPGATRFDPLGGALAVLCDVAGRDKYPSILEGFASVDTERGVTIKCRHNPMTDEEAAMIERTDGVVVWPFVLGFVILALIKMGELTLARAYAQKLFALEGFWEYYDPSDGKGYGAPEQGWTAMLKLRVFNALRSIEHIRS